MDIRSEMSAGEMVEVMTLPAGVVSPSVAPITGTYGLGETVVLTLEDGRVLEVPRTARVAVTFAVADEQVAVVDDWSEVAQ
jgi:hypothetical protein